MLQGMLIGLAKQLDIKEALLLIESFVPKIKNWAVCDVFCGELKITVKNKDIIWQFIQKYLKSKKMTFISNRNNYLHIHLIQKIFALLINISFLCINNN